MRGGSAIHVKPGSLNVRKCIAESMGKRLTLEVKSKDRRRSE